MPAPDRHTLITGGAGFIGTNLAEALAEAGETVVLLDDLSRHGVERNVRSLSRSHSRAVRLVRGDCRDINVVRRVVEGASSVFHLAAQVAVTTSIDDPMRDFDVNARGTLNVLESVRRAGRPIPVIFTSTNKVYGALDDVALGVAGSRLEPLDSRMLADGVDESRALQFHSPYGCSKGAADQYVLDYARTFDVPALVFRMSCIYGPHQLGNEDQGWVAHFLRCAVGRRPITIYGDGRQVRDALYVGDLVKALIVARDRARDLSARTFNIGGGVGNTTSLLELLERISVLCGASPEVTFAPARLADQRYYVSNVAAFTKATGWRPSTPLEEGLRRLADWISRDEAEDLSSAEPARVAGLGR